MTDQSQQPVQQQQPPAKSPWTKWLLFVLAAVVTPGVVATVISIVMASFAVQKQTERANQIVADQLRQLGAIDHRIAEATKKANLLEEQVGHLDDTVQELRQLKPEDLRLIVAMVQQPEMQAALQAGELQKQIDEIGRQVAVIYTAARLAAEKPFHEHPHAFRNCLAEAWESQQKQFARQRNRGYSDARTAHMADSVLRSRMIRGTTSKKAFDRTVQAEFSDDSFNASVQEAKQRIEAARPQRADELRPPTTQPHWQTDDQLPDQ